MPEANPTPTGTKPAANRPCRVPLSIIWAFVCFAALWLLDFPKPTIDDLFHAGAGLHLAAGGDFSNPWLIRQQFPTHFFLVYPPVHPHLLAGWLKLFGISARSVTAYELAVYFLAAVGTIGILRRHGAPAWLAWLVPLGVNTAFFSSGLRPDPLAMALAISGFALLRWARAASPRQFVGSFLLFLGIATAPRVTPFAIILALIAGGYFWRDTTIAGAKTRRLRSVAVFFAAWLAAFLLFLWFIDFRLAEFLAVFRFHSNIILESSRLGQLVRFFKVYLGLTQLPMLLLVFVLGLLSLRQRLTELSIIALILLIAVPADALIGGLGHGTSWFAILGLFFLTASLRQQTARRIPAQALAVLVPFVLVVANSNSLLNIIGTLSGGIHSDRGGQYAEAITLRSTPEHPLLIDSAAARYTYGYRLPEGAIDWAFSAPFPAELATDVKLRPEDIFIIGPNTVDEMRRKGCLDLPTPKWSPMGLRRWAVQQYPRRVYIIPAKTCRQPDGAR